MIRGIVISSVLAGAVLLNAQTADEIVGKHLAAVGGKDADTYKLKLTSKENLETVFVIDSTTYLLKSVITKSKMQGQDVNITTTLSDYRKTDVGFLVPYAVNVDLGGQFSLSIAVKKVELNKTIDPSIFSMPKAGQ